MPVDKLVEYYSPEGKERVGFILTTGEVIEVENIASDPYGMASVDPAFLVKNEDRLLGTWHTHPGEPSRLSGEDYQSFCNWPDLEHFIVGADGVSKYLVREGRVVHADEDRSPRSPA